MSLSLYVVLMRNDCASKVHCAESNEKPAHHSDNLAFDSLQLSVTMQCVSGYMCVHVCSDKCVRLCSAMCH